MRKIPCTIAQARCMTGHTARSYDAKIRFCESCPKTLSPCDCDKHQLFQNRFRAISKTIKIQKYDPQGAVVACLPACVLRELWKVGKLNTIIIAHATGLAQVLPKTTAMHMHVYAQQQHEVLMLSRITKNTMRAKTHHGESTDMHMHGYAQQYEVLMLSRITKKIHGEQKNMN